MQKDFNDDVRSEAASALGSLRARPDSDQVAALEEPQNREYNNVRVAIVSVGQIRDASAAPRSNAHCAIPTNRS
jgi:HEAT repeat protein